MHIEVTFVFEMRCWTLLKAYPEAHVWKVQMLSKRAQKFGGCYSYKYCNALFLHINTTSHIPLQYNACNKSW